MSLHKERIHGIFYFINTELSGPHQTTNNIYAGISCRYRFLIKYLHLDICFMYEFGIGLKEMANMQTKVNLNHRTP